MGVCSARGIAGVVLSSRIESSMRCEARGTRARDLVEGGIHPLGGDVMRPFFRKR